MNTNRYDERIRRAITAGTQGAAGAKDELWRRVEHEIRRDEVIRKRKRARILPKLAAAAAVVFILTASAFTPAGQAAVRRIAGLFAPQKDITLDLEGQQELTRQQLHVGQTPATETDDPAQDAAAVTYVIYVDESRYQSAPAEMGERFVPIDYPADYPEVSFSIVQDTGLTPDALALNYRGYLGEHYPIVGDAETVTDPLPAIHIRAMAGTQWDDEVVEYYLVDNTRGGTFIITLRYFVEAEEGHGARFHEMLGEFKVVQADPQ